jgi:hypothetical protein
VSIEDEEDEGDDGPDKWYQHKSAVMETVLGEEHDMVMHAIIPYAVGGSLDLYYYPNKIPGTAVATKELSEAPGEGSANAVFKNYELVMFTRHPLSLEDASGHTPFGRAHANINSILNMIARYSAQATLNPRETCEFPKKMEVVGGKCLIFDAYSDAPADFGLMAVIEVFRSEMDFARANGGDELFNRLKAAGHYPYSDLDRDPVVDAPPEKKPWWKLR